jgi:aminoglycoside phosphotransferase (APT) family kinase protein
LADLATLDEKTLTAYLAGRLPGFQAPLRIQKFAGGQSNPTYRLDTPDRTYVLRRKPPGTLLKSAHMIEREHTVMQALAESGVPVPRMHLYCEDDSIIGSAFFIMQHLEGRIFWDPALPELSIAERGRLYDEMNRVLAVLHKLDPQACGLGDFGRPGSYFARQINRWSAQYKAAETDAIPEMEALIAWLADHQPADDGRVALVHGDYRLDNMIFDTRSTRMLALLDWELSTLGHPFSDLAYQCMQWRLANDSVFRGLGGVKRNLETGIPSEEAYVEAYCRRMGLATLPHWSFLIAFSFFRLAAILQGVLRRSLDGNGSNPERGKAMGRFVPLLARMALEDIENQG